VLKRMLLALRVYEEEQKTTKKGGKNDNESF
jgi:hypothetical protein